MVRMFQSAETHLFVRGVDRRGERCAKGTIRIVAWGELCGRLSEVQFEGAFVKNLAFDAFQADCADPNRDIGSRRLAAAKELREGNTQWRRRFFILGK